MNSGAKVPRVLRPLAPALAIVAVVFAFIWVFAQGACDNTVTEELPSPDGQWKAVVFVRSCGATTDFSTHVSIIKVSEHIRSKDTGNVFIADSNHGAAPVRRSGELFVDVRWTANYQLRIRYSPASRTFVMERNHGNRNVDFQPQIDY